MNPTKWIIRTTMVLGVGRPLTRYIIGAILFVIALVFVYRSFYAMRIPEESTEANATVALPGDMRGSKV